ncbi:hypothetical protein WJX73_000096 [Symbiochloris irregularis]|uniref:RRM domain-containing protein n=1 Tax=Symbiochloris irregularis TaxID=706552 RepID=A0AAW1NXN9_9CHLO
MRHGSARMQGGQRSSAKVFVGGLSWTTDASRLRSYFSNWGEVSDAFVSYDRDTGRPRGFGFVVFSDPRVADRVISLQHTVDRREVEAKKAVPKVEQAAVKPLTPSSPFSRTKKIFVGGLAPSVDETVFRLYFERFGEVEDAVVMYDHDNKRPRGFGFITFFSEDSVDQVLCQGPMQTLHDKPIEIKRAVPREQMPAGARPTTAARPVSAYAGAASRAFGPSLSKSAGLGLADNLGLSSSGLGNGYSGMQGLGTRLSSLGIPAVRTQSGLTDYDALDGHSLGAAQGLDLLLSSQQHRAAPPLSATTLSSLGLDDLALLQNTGLAASMGQHPAPSPHRDISGAQSLPTNLEEVLQGLHLGQQGLHSRLSAHDPFTSALLATQCPSPAPLGATSLAHAFDHQAISAGQHW